MNGSVGSSSLHSASSSEAVVANVHVASTVVETSTTQRARAVVTAPCLDFQTVHSAPRTHSPASSERTTHLADAAVN